MKHIVEAATKRIQLALKWSGKVKTKEGVFPEGFFTQSQDDIAKGLKSRSEDLQQAMSRLNFYINRAGDNLDADEIQRLEGVKDKLRALYD